MVKQFTILLLFLFSASLIFAQSGEIQGKVTDADSGEGLPFANVSVVVGGVTTGAQTDFDGFYSIKPIAPGTYDVETSYLGYQSQITKGVLVTADKITFLDVKMAEESELLAEVVVIDYKVPLIKADETGTGSTVTKEDIDNLPTRNVNSIASTSAGVYQSDEGEDVNVKGSRDDATDYYIDGIKVRGSSAIPTQSIEQVSVLTGGLPSKYGDATGGIINITTRGPSNKFSGGVELMTSQFLDAYGYNLATGSVSGPLLKLNKGTDQERPLLGFFVAGEYLYEKDDDPAAGGVYVLKEEPLNEIREFPLLFEKTADGGIIRKRSEFLTLEDIETSKFKPNTAKDRIGGTVKFDFQPIKNLNFTLGGTYNYQNRNEWIHEYTLANTEGNREEIDETYRGYFRFTQRFGGQTIDPEATPSLFSNAYYSVQLDYTKDYTTQQSSRHRDNFFNYGYVGAFESSRLPNLSEEGNRFAELGDDEQDESIQRSVFNDYRANGVSYVPNFDINPDLATYTDQFFDIARENNLSNFYSSITEINANRGIINGSRDRSYQTAYNIWYNPGRVIGSNIKYEDDQYRVQVNGSVDIKAKNASERNKHAIEFGVEYEQRIDRQWAVLPVQVWDRMRLSANSHLGSITRDDKDRARLFVLLNKDSKIPYTIDDYRNDAIDYENIDSVSIYDYQSDDNFITTYDLLAYEYGTNDTPSNFAVNIRNALGVSNNTWLDVDNIDPSVFSLDMLSAEELVSAGAYFNSYVYGFDYSGKRFSTQPRFEDFFENMRNGSLALDVPAYQPIYMAGYIQDKFAFKDLVFNVGLRVDRFDANQKVLKDRFSLYGVRTSEEIDGALNIRNGGEHPGNVGDDWVVYGDDPLASEVNNITAYRDGKDWYNALGEFVKDPRVLSQNGDPIPITAATSESQLSFRSSSYDPSLSFEDYTPQITIMPRLAFSFNMSENAQFFAHYDQLSQRPQDRINATAFSYYFFEERNITRLENPNLKPEKTIDYQVGFRQRLSQSSALTIAGFYREIKDMIQLTNVNYAYPRTYSTWLNEDFGTIKGLELTYDLRRTGNIRLLTTYTLQFAEGTGSDDESAEDIVGSGQPNLRAIYPLSYDSRHLFVSSIDYRFKSGSKYNGPKIGNFDVLAGFGLNATIRARSGEPYSKQTAATAEGIIGRQDRSSLDGSLNGSRLPWNAKVDLKADKDFVWKTGGKDGSSQKSNTFNLYLQIQNLFNTKNILEVHQFTGIPGDDGYLEATAGRIEQSQSVNPLSFEQLYRLRVDEPDHYTRPRTIRLGASYNF